ncbi:MAG: iron ABC transporter permease [Anaerolineaceae bacterium]|nr:iron ABC transporter permease [Anaerolineaceae bacterium]
MRLRPAARPYLYSMLLLVTALIISIGIGSVFISPNNLAQIFIARLLGKPINTEVLKPFETIIFSLRLPRTFLIAITGAALAGSGAAYQGLFQNPLADPYLIGVASGAGLGAVISMSVDWPYTLAGYMTIPVFAFIGALATVFIVYQLAKVGGSVPTTNLILAGVVVGSFATAITSFLMIKSTDEIRRAIVFLMGGATMSGWPPVLAVLPYSILGLGILLTMGHALNVLQYGDEQAQQMGLNVKKVRLIIIITASLTTAAAVSFTGIIGFIGLIIPHTVRFLWGGDYRRLTPLAIINGAGLLLIADVLARILMAPQEIPIGIITALFGAPFFLWIMRRAGQQNYW